jgi:hypothetical protein
MSPWFRVRLFFCVVSLCIFFGRLALRSSAHREVDEEPSVSRSFQEDEPPQNVEPPQVHATGVHPSQVPTVQVAPAQPPREQVSSSRPQWVSLGKYSTLDAYQHNNQAFTFMTTKRNAVVRWTMLPNAAGEPIPDQLPEGSQLSLVATSDSNETEQSGWVTEASGRSYDPGPPANRKSSGSMFLLGPGKWQIQTNCTAPFKLEVFQSSADQNPESAPPLPGFSQEEFRALDELDNYLHPKQQQGTPGAPQN